jgi:hypothetical protein
MGGAAKHRLSKAEASLVNKLVDVRRKKVKSRTHKHEKFINGSTTAMKRRNQRKYRKTLSSNKKKKQTIASKSTQKKKDKGSGSQYDQPRPCCGRRGQKCICFESGRGAEIVKSMSKKEFCKLRKGYENNPIQIYKDTDDMSKYEEQIPEGLSYRFLWFYTFMWRFFSNDAFWTALVQVKAVSYDREPNWNKVREVMEIFNTKGTSFFGGLFYTGNVLLFYRYDVCKDWSDCKKLRIDTMGGYIEALKVVYYCIQLIGVYLDELEISPSRAGFRVCTKGLYTELGYRTSGMFGHYSIKIMLDGLFIRCPELLNVCSWFPMFCTAYVSELPKLYPILKTNDEEDMFLAACHLLRTLRGRGKRITLQDALAQLCWLKRKVST